MLQLLVGCLLTVYLHLYHRLRIEGKERIPRTTPFVLIANHESHLDTLVLLAALPTRLRGHVFPLAAGDTFFTSRPRAILLTATLNLLQMRRASSNRHALNDLRGRLLEGGTALILYPEGTRGDGSSLAPFKPGIGCLVAGTTIPVIPCQLSGCGRSLPKTKSLPRPHRITVRFGEPLTFESHENTKEDWSRIASGLHDRMRTLAT
ncbi:MAG: lysophospholipid acyltransferase family protein [Phycisphaerales bacterium JB043]